MLRYIVIISLLFSAVSFGQEIPDNAPDALKEYVSKRSGYKHSGSKLFSRTEQYEMDDYCFAMEEKFPDAWQTDYMWFLNDSYYTDRGERINDAYKKAPNEKQVVKALFGYAVMKTDLAKQKELASKVLGYYSSNTLDYYSRLFPSTGVVIVSSSVEAIPMYALQLKKGKGKGVTVVNMDFLMNDEYRKSMANKLGTGSQKFAHNEATYVATALSTKKVYLSTTVSQVYLSEISKKTYTIGLVYEANIQNQQDKLQKFWKSLAGVNFSSMSLKSSEKRLYTNYLPPLMTLYKMKLMGGKKDAALRKAIVVIAGKVGQTKTVNGILEDYEKG